LLEVMVAMAILGLAVVTTIQLVSQSLRLLRLAGEHQQASVLADRLLREAPPDAADPQQGEEGPFAWERRTSQIPIPEEMGLPGQPAPGLTAITVSVRWGKQRSLEFSTLRLTPSTTTPRAR
jgi:hypothetical protein